MSVIQGDVCVSTDVYIYSPNREVDFKLKILKTEKSLLLSVSFLQNFAINLRICFSSQRA